ncbi:MAG: HEAT repeat domain-containing protein, partial [Thermodesulfobacteriota bacterium]
MAVLFAVFLLALPSPALAEEKDTEGLISDLRNGDLAARESAVSSLWKTDDPSAIEALVFTALRDESREVRENATNTLSYVDVPVDISPFVTGLKDPNADIRGNAAYVLGIFRDEGTFEPLRAALNDESPEVRAKAARAISSLDNPGVAEALLSVSKDSVPEVRAAAIRGLPRSGNPRALEQIAPAMKDASALVRSTAAEALGLTKEIGLIEGSEGVSLLIQALEDEEPSVRRAAAGAMGSFKDPVSTEPLINALLKDGNPDVRRA